MAISPDVLDARVAKAASLHYSRKDFEAELILRQVLAADPEHVRAHLLKAQMLLARGDEAGAWPHWERRYAMPGMAERVLPWKGMPTWTGEDAARLRLVIHPEQGMGDVFLFSRWLKPLAGRCAEATLVVHHGISRLMEECLDRGRGRVIAEGSVLDGGAIDRQAWMASLPFLTGLGPADLPPEPWMRAPPERVEAWRRRLAGPGLSVGLCWAGNPGLARDEERSAPLGVLEPLLRVPGCRFFSLQVGPAEAELGAIDPQSRPVALGPELASPAPDNFRETAAALAAFDVVISVDTAVANLAGAMGLPVWVMLPFVAEWRWRRSGPSTPWLPSACLFRQPERHAWAPVAADLACALEAKTGGAHSPAGV